MREQNYKIVILYNALGLFIFTVGMLVFAVPAKIAPGGTTGIAILINYITGFPIGIFTSLFNLPLLYIILKKRIFSRGFVVKITSTTLLLTLMIDTLGPVMPTYKGDPLLAALFAGTLMGIGLALIYIGTSDTGGITLIGLIIQKKYPHFPMGILTSVMNIIIVLASGVVYSNLESILYAILTVYVAGLFMDKMVSDFNAKDLMMVMSDHTDAIRCIFINEKKGITILKGEGGYTSEVQKVIMGAVRKSDSMRIQKKILQVDPKALIIVADASNVIGKNFGHMI